MLRACARSRCAWKTKKLVEVPAAILLSRVLGLSGVWAAYPITFCAMLLLQMAFYWFVWRKKKIERLI